MSEKPKWKIPSEQLHNVTIEILRHVRCNGDTPTTVASQYLKACDEIMDKVVEHYNNAKESLPVVF